MSAGGTVSSPVFDKELGSSVINLFTFTGDAQTTADHDMRRASPQVLQHQEYPSFPHTSTGSSPSDSPLIGIETLPADVSQSHSLFDQEYELGYSQQLPLDIHPLQSHATPPLPDYRPMPPLSPRTILATLDDIANAGPKKKSHARKQPAGHIPRPRNAFILFRCLFVSQQSVPASVEKDHRNISRIAGRVWKAMSEEDREPWIRAADIEKARHEQRWPGYRYNPVQTNPTQFKRTVSGATFPNGLRTPSSITSRMENNGGERLGRTLVRAHQQQDVQRTFKHPELPVQYPTSQQMSPISEFPLHAPLPRIASVPPTLNTEHDPRYLEALSLSSIHFTDPFHNTGAPSSAIDIYGNTPTPPSTYFEGSLPPDSPVVITSHSSGFGQMVPPRRSSSCPPLPPPGSSGFSFNSSPIILQTPYNTHFPHIPVVDSDMDSTGLFRNPFHSNSHFGATASLFTGANSNSMPTSHSDDHRSVVNVLDPLSPPSTASRLLHLDTNCRLMHRRGSSLDRALANSTLAGVFGGFSRSSQHWINPWLESSHLIPNTVIQRSQPIALPESQLVANSTNQHNHSVNAQYPDASLGSSDTETPGLSPSPQSSFENVVDAMFQTQTQIRTPQARVVDSFSIPKDLFGRTSTPKTVIASSQPRSPLDDESENYKLSDRKVSGRLFGSQGVRLGLDLDLESPLSLDKEGGLLESHFVSQSAGSDSPSYPYTPASASGLSPSIFNYPYHTHTALLDPDMELSSQEFHITSDK